MLDLSFEEENKYFFESILVVSLSSWSAECEKCHTTRFVQLNHEILSAVFLIVHGQKCTSRILTTTMLISCNNLLQQTNIRMRYHGL